MNKYMISRTEGKPEWSAIPFLSVDRVLWEPDWGIRAGGQFCYDDSNLYVHLKAAEEDIRAEYTAPLSPVCRDSCLEFFFMPEKDDRYMNFEINPKGCLYIGLGHGRGDHVMLYKENPEKYFDIRTFRTEEGWEVYYRIPLEFLRVFYRDVSFAGEWRANVYKCGDETRNRHYLSWNQVTSESPDFHRPQDFGCMVFEASPQD